MYKIELLIILDLKYSIISINQRSIVLRTAIENGGQTEFDFSFNQYLSTKDTAYLIACAGSRDPATLNR